MYDVVVMGNPAVDALCNDVSEDILKENGLRKGDFHQVEMDVFFQINDACMVEKFEPGGSTANTAYALGKMGMKTAFVGRIGDDPAGRHFIAEMKSVGVFTPKPDADVRTMEIYVLITPDGERTFAMPGVTPVLGPEMVDEKLISSAKWLLVEGYMLLDQHPAVKQAIGYARTHGVKVALTLASHAVLERAFEYIAAEIEEGLDLIIANEEEMNTLLSAVRQHSEAGGSALEAQVNATPRVITRSGEGASFINGEDETFAATRKVENPTDTTGAGDAFAAGFLFHYVKDGDAKKGLERGHQLAGQVIMRTGARITSL